MNSKLVLGDRVTEKASTESAGPLEGFRVIDVSTILAGPLCCQILGDFGADVVKIEHPLKGDGMRGHGPSKDGIPLWWKEISRNKRTVALNIGRQEGASVLLRLLETADVLVESFRPGTLERWGLAPEVLLAVNPRLIIARISGFGQKGPYAERAGFGTLAEAMSGFAELTGQADGPPTLPAFGLADSICGIAASSAVSMALLHRERTGKGQILDISLLEPILAAVGPGPTAYQQLGTVEKRRGNRSMNNSPRNIYRTRDSRWVAVSTSAQNIAERVLTMVGHPEVIAETWFSSGRERALHADLLDDLVGSWIGMRNRDDVVKAFEAAGAAIAPIYNARDLVEDDHVRQSAMLIEIDDGDLGPVLMHNVMWRMSDSPGSIRFSGRGLGHDTDAVLLNELGYDEEALAILREEQVIS